MLVIEFLSGPGAGKTSSATSLYSKLKRKTSIENIDYVREYAQHSLHMGCGHRLNNQLALVSDEYDRLFNMKEQGCKVLITDTSLLLTRIYGRSYPYYSTLVKLVDELRRRV